MLVTTSRYMSAARPNPLGPSGSDKFTLSARLGDSGAGVRPHGLSYAIICRNLTVKRRHQDQMLFRRPPSRCAAAAPRSAGRLVRLCRRRPAATTALHRAYPFPPLVCTTRGGDCPRSSSPPPLPRSTLSLLRAPRALRQRCRFPQRRALLREHDVELVFARRARGGRHWTRRDSAVVRARHLWGDLK